MDPSLANLNSTHRPVRSSATLCGMSDPTTWYVLLHTPGPAVPDGEKVFEQPGIAEHFAFLQRRADAGELVAAGPFGDAPDGAGMTVLDVPSLEDADRLAREDDQSVVTGVLAVSVRPWLVRLAR
jgi:uncharacterized protein YciI